jgi:uroporphyrinogen decarboxylase
MNTTFLDACYGKKTAYTPVWYMRQAGRYLPEYRKLKERHTILDIVKTPELAAKVSMQPVDILDVDAAILFADIMIPLLGIGVDLDIVESIGPVIAKPIRTITDVKALRKLEPSEDIPYLLDAIAILKKELQTRVPLIGFSAAPFTLASYLIEGKPTRDFILTKTLMYSDRRAWDLLMKKLTDMIIIYLKSQTKAGVQAIQLFDSWVGALSKDDYVNYILPYTKQIFESLRTENVPLIHFGTNTAGILDSFASVDCDVISIDWRMPIATAWQQIGYEKSIQGNLDPVVLLSDFPTIKKHVDSLFSSLPKREGFIFNLGHGVLQQTPVDNIKRLTEYVHKKSK